MAGAGGQEFSERHTLLLLHPVLSECALLVTSAFIDTRHVSGVHLVPSASTLRDELIVPGKLGVYLSLMVFSPDPNLVLLLVAWCFLII